MLGRSGLKKTRQDWPRKAFYWTENGINFVSIPFTWELPKVRAKIVSDLFRGRYIVGGPAVKLIPGFFDDLAQVEIQDEAPGILQRINPQATRTSIGCFRRCSFCGVKLIEPGGFRALDEWPDLPVLCDNNLLASPRAHFDKVIDRLVALGSADFNQGLDARLLTEYHVGRIREIKYPIVRLSCDNEREIGAWIRAFELLIAGGIAKSRIRTYCLIAFEDTPAEAWDRCNFISEKTAGRVAPLWFHTLDQLSYNAVTAEQKDWGWSVKDQRELMQFFYWRREPGKPRLSKGTK